MENTLLQWGIRNAQQTGTDGSRAPTIQQIHADIQAGKRPDLQDPGLIEAIMGKSDAQLMQEAIQVATNKEAEVSSRVTALDNLELLIEHIDNANNLTVLNMWNPLLRLLSDPSDEIRLQALWVIGTAVQNNPKAQEDFLRHDPLPLLLAPLTSASPELRSKAMYALSSTLKHAKPEVLQRFEELGGWEALKAALLDPNVNLRRKVAFLLNTLLLQDPANTKEHRDEPEQRNAPAGLLGAPPPSASSGTSSGQTGSTAVAPAPAQTDAAASSKPRRPPQSNAFRAMRVHSLLTLLVGSLLVPSQVIPPAGPDGDQDETDADYSEKALRTVYTWLTCGPKEEVDAFLQSPLASQQQQQQGAEAQAQPQGPIVSTTAPSMSAAHSSLSTSFANGKELMLQFVMDMEERGEELARWKEFGLRPSEWDDVKLACGFDLDA